VRHEVPLADELAAVDDYVAVMAARFDGRVDVRVDAAPDTASALVPRLLLQPLVENALRHGVDRHTGAVCVTVRARRAPSGDALELEVIDAGPGPGASAAAGLGVGLAVTRQRLETLYGAAQRLTLDAPAGGGARVRVTLPFRPGPDA
jgi:LytS/YehU family sensor histidine kinase